MKLNAHAIVAAACLYFGLSHADVYSRHKRHKFAFARATISWLCRKYTPLSYPQIGRLIRKHHTTILLAERRMGKSIDSHAGGWWTRPRAVVRIGTQRGECRQAVAEVLKLTRYLGGPRFKR